MRDVERAVEATEVARVTEAREARRVVQEAEREVARRRTELQARARRALSENDLAALEARLRQLGMEVDRRKELVERGLATRQNLTAAENQLSDTRLQLERARIQHEMAGHELVLRRHENLSTLESNAVLQAEDRLTITIDGEPDLPTGYTVRADGSIRFPLLGSIRVQGSTTAQVQSAMEKLLSDKGLARNPAVTVSAGRSR